MNGMDEERAERDVGVASYLYVVNYYVFKCMMF